jgi:hypothetical protein
LNARRVMPGARRLSWAVQREVFMDDEFKETIWFHLVFILWVAVLPLAYVFQFWLSNVLAYVPAVFIAGLLSYALARKIGMSFFQWVGLSLLSAGLFALLTWTGVADSPAPI